MRVSENTRETLSAMVSAATRSAFLPLTEWCPHRFEGGRVVKNGALDVRLATAPAASRIVDVAWRGERVAVARDCRVVVW